MKLESGFTLLELLIVVVILGILALIATPTLLNAADKAKEGAVKANASAAAASVTTYLTVDELDGDDAAERAANHLNAGGTSDDDTDNAKNPFNTEIDAFVAGESGTAGQVVLSGNDGEYSVTIMGLDKNADILRGAMKTVVAPMDSENSDDDDDDDDDDDSE